MLLPSRKAPSKAPVAAKLAALPTASWSSILHSASGVVVAEGHIKKPRAAPRSSDVWDLGSLGFGPLGLVELTFLLARKDGFVFIRKQSDGGWDRSPLGQPWRLIGVVPVAFCSLFVLWPWFLFGPKAGSIPVWCSES